MFNKVLVAIDLSGPSLELLDATDDLKKMGMEELVIVHVVRLETARLGVEDCRQKFMEIVEDKQKELKEKGYKITVRQPVGDPAEEIERISEEENVDLIMIGSIGKGRGRRFRELVQGSTVNNLIKIGKKPLLVIKYRVEGGKYICREMFPDKKPATALLATDFSRNSMETFDFVIGNKKYFDKIVLLHVIDKGYPSEQIEDKRCRALEKLAQWQQKFEDHGYSTETIVDIGIASREISKRAKEKGATVIVFSRVGRGIINEYFIGSTADPVVRQSMIPVFLLKK